MTLLDDAPLNLGRQSAWLATAALSSTATNLLLVPVLYAHLGSAAFGVWSTLIGLLALLVVFDVGNAVVHRLTPLLATGRTGDSQSTVAAALVLITGMALVLTLLFLVVSALVDWAAVWNAPAALAGQTRAATYVVVVTAMIGLPISLVDRLNVARGRAIANAGIASGVAVATAGALLLGVAADASLPWMVAAGTAPSVVVRGIALALLIGKTSELRPARWTKGHIVALLASSVGFGTLQLTATLGYNADQVVIARLLGPADVTDYAIPAKGFAVLVVVVGAITAPLWSALVAETAKGRMEGLKALAQRGTLLAGAVSVTWAAGLLLFGRPLIELWVGEGYQQRRDVLVAFACWGIVYAFTNVPGFVLLALDGLRDMIAIACVTVVLNIGLSVLLTRQMGPAGAIWGSVVSYLVATAFPLSLRIRTRWLRLETAT